MISPAVGRSMPARRPSNVALPLPDCPTIRVSAPGSIERLTSLSARKVPAGVGKLFDRLRVMIAARAVVSCVCGMRCWKRVPHDMPRIACCAIDRGAVHRRHGAVQRIASARTRAARAQCGSRHTPTSLPGEPLMRVRIAAAVGLLLPTLAFAQHAPSGAGRPALTPAKEASQFDFLIGQWELVVTPKVNSLAAKIHGAPTFVGTWKAWRAGDGFGVEDETRILDRSGNPTALGQALRVYSANERRWLLTSIDAYRGKATSGTGEWKGTEMVITGRGVDEEGKTLQTR